MSAERRFSRRRKINYYLRVVDLFSHQLVGHFSDISPRGFQVDSPQPVLVDKEYKLRIDLTGDISEKAYIAVVARSRWLHLDPMDPNLHNIGFEIVGISPQDQIIYQRMIERYSFVEVPR